VSWKNNLEDLLKVKLIYVGVDIHPPTDEMANRLVESLANSETLANVDRIEIWSIQLKKSFGKELSGPGTSEITPIPLGQTGKVGQLVRLFFLLTRLDRNCIVHYVGNGKQSLLMVMSTIAKLVGYRLIFSFLSKTRYFYLPKSVEFVLPYRESTGKFLFIPPASNFASRVNNSSSLKKIAFASVPRKQEEFHEAGIHLLFDAARLSTDLEFHILNRFDYLKNDLEQIAQDLPNVFIHNETISDIESEFLKYDAFIAPYVELGRAEIPLSLVEALTLGKPVLVSNKIEMAQLVNKYNCGVSFAPDASSLKAAIELLARDYKIYSSKTRIIHDQEFSILAMLERYKRLYFHKDF